MTANAGSVARIVSDIGEVSHLFPVVRWYLVTGVAGALVFLGSVGEARVVDGGGRCDWLTLYRCSPSFLSSCTAGCKIDRSQESGYCQDGAYV